MSYYGWMAKAKEKPDTTPVSASCSRCGANGRWVDHGHTVGKGWYCGICKDDISHPDNTYGSSGKQIINSRGAVQKAAQAISNTTRYDQLDCRKNGCKICNGKFKSGPGIMIVMVDIKIGDWVRTENFAGVRPHLGNGSMHEVVGVDNAKGTIHVLVDSPNTKPERREYSRCRFSKRIK